MHDRVLLDAQGMERRVVDPLERVDARPPGTRAIRGREQDPHPTLGLRVGGKCGGRASRGKPLVEEPVHPRDPGGHDPVLGDPERLGIERDVELRTDDRVGVVLVGARPRVQAPRPADPAVAHGFERARGVPELDHADVRVEVHREHDPLSRVLDEDDVGGGKLPPQHDALTPGEPAGPDPEGRPDLKVAVEAALHHPVVDDPQVPTEHGTSARDEEDAAARPASDELHQREQARVRPLSVA